VKFSDSATSFLKIIAAGDLTCGFRVVLQVKLVGWQRCHGAAGKTVWRAALSLTWSSAIMSLTPIRSRVMMLSVTSHENDLQTCFK
jgi:hypothetical protein